MSSVRSVMQNRESLNEVAIQKLLCLNQSIDDLNSSYVPQRLMNVTIPKVNGFVSQPSSGIVGAWYPLYSS